MRFLNYTIVLCLFAGLSFACSNRTKVIGGIKENEPSISSKETDHVDDQLVSSDEDAYHPRKATNEHFFSDLRPLEKLYTNTMYVDTVELIEYNDDSDYWFIRVRKDTAEVVLLNAVDEELALHRRYQQGDIVQIEWEMDSMWVAGDGESLWIEEWTKNISRIK